MASSRTGNDLLTQRKSTAPKPRKGGRKFTEREATIYPLTQFWPALSFSPLSLNVFLFFFFFEEIFNFKENGS